MSEEGVCGHCQGKVSAVPKILYWSNTAEKTGGQIRQHFEQREYEKSKIWDKQEPMKKEQWKKFGKRGKDKKLYKEKWVKGTDEIGTKKSTETTVKEQKCVFGNFFEGLQAITSWLKSCAPIIKGGMGNIAAAYTRIAAANIV